MGLFENILNSSIGYILKEEREMSPFEEYKAGYPDSNFNAESLTIGDLVDWCENNDFLYIVNGLRGWNVSAANSGEIVDDILDDLTSCQNIEPTHEKDYLLEFREDLFRNDYVAVIKVVMSDESETFYIIYQESKDDVLESVESEGELLMEGGDTRVKRVEKFLQAIFPNMSHEEFKSKLDAFREKFHLKGNENICLLPNLVKVAYGDLSYQQAGEQQEKLRYLDEICQMIVQNKDNDRDTVAATTGLTFAQLWKVYGKRVEKKLIRDKKDAKKQVDNSNPDYSAPIRLKTMQEAWVYGQYTGHVGDGTPNTGQLCYSHIPGWWDRFTDNNRRELYVALRNDWKEVKAPTKEEVRNGLSPGYPRDFYGTSMIWFFIDRDENDVTNSNVRWNHGNGGKPYDRDTDKQFSLSEIGSILGINMASYFNLTTHEEVVDTALKQIKKGVPLTDIFEDCHDMGYGMTKVYLKNLGYNIITSRGGMLYRSYLNWLQSIEPFGDKAFIIKDKYRRHNILRRNGTLVFGDEDGWIEDVTRIRNTDDKLYCFRSRKKGLNIVSKNLVPLIPLNSEKWLGKVICSDLSFIGKSKIPAVARLISPDFKENFLDANGNLILKNWVSGVLDTSISGLSKHGLCLIISNGKYNIYSLRTQNVIYGSNDNTDEWFTMINGHFTYTDYGCLLVKKDSKYNLFNINNRALVSPDRWFTYIDSSLRGTKGEYWETVVNLGLYHYNVLKSDGSLLCKDRCFYNIHPTMYGYYIVKNAEEESNFLSPEGELLYKSDDKWFYDYKGPNNFFYQDGTLDICIMGHGYNKISWRGELFFTPEDGHWFQEWLKDYNDKYYKTKFYEKDVLVNKKNSTNIIPLTPKDELKSNKIEIGEDLGEGLVSVVKKDANGNNWRYNIMDRKKHLLSPNAWFDEVRKFKNGYAFVRVANNAHGWQNKTLIDTSGNLIPNPNTEGEDKFFFSVCDTFSEGCVGVQIHETWADKNEAWTFVGKDGNPVFYKKNGKPRCFYRVQAFSDGKAIVWRNQSSMNVLLRDGTFLTKQWLRNIEAPRDGIMVVKDTNNNKNYMDENGNFILERWVWQVDAFNNGFGKVRNYNGRRGYNFVDRQGKPLFEDNVDDCVGFADGIGFIKEESSEQPGNEQWWAINTKGEKISQLPNDVYNIFRLKDGKTIALQRQYPNDENGHPSEYFYEFRHANGSPIDSDITVYSYEDCTNRGNWVLVRASDSYRQYSVLDLDTGHLKNSNLRFQLMGWYTSYDKSTPTVARQPIIVTDEKYNFLRDDGEIMFPDMWFDKIHTKVYGTLYNPVRVEKDGKVNYADVYNKRLISDEWLYAGAVFDRSSGNDNNGAVVYDEVDKPNLMNADGQMLLPKGLCEYIGGECRLDDMSTNKQYKLYKIRNQEGKCNCVTADGRILLPDWYYDVDFMEGNTILCLIPINDQGLMTPVRMDGTFCTPHMWFNEVKKKGDENFLVKLGEKYNILNPLSGQLLSQVWLDNQPYSIRDTKSNDRLYIICVDGHWNVLNGKTRKYISNLWFSYVDRLGNLSNVTLFKVERVINGKNMQNIMNGNGKLVSPRKWFDSISLNSNGIISGFKGKKEVFRKRMGPDIMFSSIQRALDKLLV